MTNIHADVSIYDPVSLTGTTISDVVTYKSDNCLWFLWGCLHDCCVPTLVAASCCCISPKLSITSRNQAQLWTMRQPASRVSCCRCCCYYCDLLYDFKPGDTGEFFVARRNIYREQGRDFFCAFNKVNVWMRTESEHILLSDQYRDTFLGNTDLVSRNLPVDKQGAGPLFLLSMSDPASVNNQLPTLSPSPSDQHKLCRDAIHNLMNSSTCLARISSNNEVMKKIIGLLKNAVSDTRADYEALLSKEVPSYLIRTLHWGVLDLDLTNEEFDIIWDLYYSGPSPGGPWSVLYHLRGFGGVLVSKSFMEKKYKKVAEIYKKSSIITNWTIRPEFRNLDQNEMIDLIQRALTLAGLQGPLAGFKSVLTGGIIPKQFDIPVHNRDQMRLVILEVLRIRPSVNGSTTVVKNALVCPFDHGKKYAVFPPNTPVVVNLLLHGQDPDMYPNPSLFDPYGRKEQLWGSKSRYTMFNGVGDCGPRMCPGRDIALELMITGLQTIFSISGAFGNDVNTTSLISETILKPTVEIGILGLQLQEYISRLEDKKRDPMISTVWLNKLSTASKAWTYLAIKLIDNSIAPRAPSAVNVFHEKQRLPINPLVLEAQGKDPTQQIVVKFALSDEEAGASYATWAMATAINSIVGMKDSTGNPLYFFPSIEEGILVGQEKFKTCLPSSEVVWKELESDDAFSALMFYGLGMMHIRRSTVKKSKSDPLVSHLLPHYTMDVSAVFKYDVRPKYEKYGATAYFDERRRPIAIWWDAGNKVVYPDDDEWSHAKCVVKSSLFLLITVRDHLAHLHLVTANGLSLACRETLSANHPLRRMLKPFYYNSASINYQALLTLVPVHGIAYKMFAISEAHWEMALYDSFHDYRYQPFPDFIAAKGFTEAELVDFPLAVDGLEYWNVVKKFITSYLDLFYPQEDSLISDPEICDYWNHFRVNQVQGLGDIGLPKDLTKESLIDIISFSVFQVTGGHEFLGGIIEYLLDPSIMPAKVIAKKNISDVQSFFLVLVAIAFTGRRQPKLINDWSHLLNSMKESADSTIQQKHPAAVEIFGAFQSDLRQLSSVIDGRNIERLKLSSGNAFNSFNPRLLECSVSI